MLDQAFVEDKPHEESKKSRNESGKMFMTRRPFFFLAWALFCFFTGYRITAALAAERVVMASLSPGLFEFPVQVAMMRGYFRDEGLDVVKVQMQPQISVMA